jgi:hypothetical protein
VKRGPKPKGKIKIEWSSNFAYAIGLLTTDGCLSKDGRHIDFTSVDIEQIENFKLCLGLSCKTGIKDNGSGFKAFRVQFGDVIFYEFLKTIGITPKKSLTLNRIKVPDIFFFDFLRGHYDGDGTFYSYWDSRWKSSHMFYLEFISASKKHVQWLQKEIKKRIAVKGSISNTTKNQSVFLLRYAKREALEIIHKMYYDTNVVHLSRKYSKIQKAFAVEQKQQMLYK